MLIFLIFLNNFNLLNLKFILFYSKFDSNLLYKFLHVYLIFILHLIFLLNNLKTKFNDKDIYNFQIFKVHSFFVKKLCF